MGKAMLLCYYFFECCQILPAFFIQAEISPLPPLARRSVEMTDVCSGKTLMTGIHACHVDPLDYAPSINSEATLGAGFTETSLLITTHVIRPNRDFSTKFTLSIADVLEVTNMADKKRNGCFLGQPFCRCKNPILKEAINLG